MSDETYSIHNSEGKEIIVFLAKVIPFPCCLVREKEKVLSQPTVNKGALTI